ncbi:MAG: sugar phosphate nucleotidyltransferase, partial [Oscillospiraceae bacterium]
TDFLISENATVADAMKQLEKSGQKILFVAPDNRLVGAVSDGDIRRYLMSSTNMRAPIMEAASKLPLYVSGYHEADARELLKQREISCVPMIGNDGRMHALVFQYATVHREKEPIDAHVIIMAGGLGTRLYPYTEILPKPLIPVGSITITEQIINRFKKFGCNRFSLVVNHKRNLIKSYFSEVKTAGELEFVDEDKPLGTAGGLSFFKGRFSGPFFITNCDNIVEADYEDILARHIDDKNILTMVCAKKTVTIPYGVVKTNSSGAMTSMLEKPSFDFLTNAGFYIASPEFVDLIADDTFTPINDVIEKCLCKGLRVGVYTIEEKCFVDIGQLEDLKSIEDKLR